MNKTDIFDVILSLKITGLKRIGEINFDYLQDSSTLPDGKGHVVLLFKEDSTTQIKEMYEAFFENKNLLRIGSSKAIIGKLTLSGGVRLGSPRCEDIRTGVWLYTFFW